MPKPRTRTLNANEQDEILFIEWLLEKMRERGNPNIDDVRDSLGLTTESGKMNTVKHIARNKNVYKNYINTSLNTNEEMYSHLLYDL